MFTILASGGRQQIKEAAVGSLSAGGWQAEVAAAGDCPNLVINQEWDVGIDSVLKFVVDHEAHGWEIHLTFDSVLTSLDCWQVNVYKDSHTRF
jgi:hypothetical protein